MARTRGPFDVVRLRCLWWYPEDPAEVGDGLITARGRRYRIVEIRGKTLHCVVLDSGDDINGRWFGWEWAPRRRLRNRPPLYYQGEVTMDQSIIPPLPRYRSHKIVQAALIISMTPGVPTTNLVLGLPDGRSTSRLVDEAYMNKHTPKVGDFYVRYADGYESCSPRPAFMEGYTLVDDGGDRAETENPDAKVERIARVCHEVNRGYCAALGDHTQLPWAEAPEWQRASAIKGVQLHLSGDHGPEASHESWMREKAETGWKYGPVKDAENKEHPCMVPFDQLAADQQAKDFIFRSVVLALA